MSEQTTAETPREWERKFLQPGEESGVTVFPSVDVWQTCDEFCRSCRRKAVAGEPGYRVTPIRFGGFARGTVIHLCDECLRQLHAALNALGKQ